MDNLKTSILRLARQRGISPDSLPPFPENVQNLTLGELQAYADALSVPISELFAQ